MDAPAESVERLTRVRIEGFRSIKHADLELRNVNVFVGANGAGKSNLIGFLQMLGTMMRGNLSRFVDEQSGANELLHFGAQKTPKLSGVVEATTLQWPVTYEFELKEDIRDRLVFAQESILTDPLDLGLLSRWSSPPGNSESTIQALSNWTKERDLGTSAFALYRLLTSIGVFHFHNSTPTSPMRRLQNMRENRLLHTQGENTTVMLIRMQKDFPQHYQRVVGEMRRILPEFRDFALEPDPFRNGEQIELRWLSRNSDYTMGPNQLSDGSIRAVSLLTLLLQPDEWRPGIIVIDEPELGLHPFAVGQIGRLIAEAGTTRQVIVSTQSPGLVAQFEPEDVVVVESESGASTFRRLDRESLGPWLEAYDGDLGRLFEMNVTGGAPA